MLAAWKTNLPQRCICNSLFSLNCVIQCELIRGIGISLVFKNKVVLRVTVITINLVNHVHVARLLPCKQKVVLNLWICRECRFILRTLDRVYSQRFFHLTKLHWGTALLQLLLTYSQPQLLLRMNSAFYVADSIVASSREEADRLMIIVTGKVRWDKSAL